MRFPQAEFTVWSTGRRFFMMPSCLIGIVVVTVHPDLLGTEGTFCALIDIFVEEGGVYAIMATVLIVSCIASFMSTADSFILALANQFVEDFWVGWLQKFAPADALGGRSMQNLIIGKIASFSVLVSSICVALYTEISFFQLLSVGFCGVWSFVFTIEMGFFFPSLRSPAVIISGLVSFPAAMYYEYNFYDFAQSHPGAPAFCGMLTCFCLLVSHGVVAFAIPNFDDHTNKGIMAWDSIDSELDRFGVAPKRKGCRMLYMHNGQWRVVQVSLRSAPAAKAVSPRAIGR